jgi:hypothetical protein
MIANTSNDTRDLEIRWMRLGTGEDIVTWCLRLYPETDAVDGWFLRDPVVVIVEVDTELLKQTVIMVPWLPRGIVDDDDCIIKEEEVIVIKKVDPDVAAYYKQLCREIFPHKPKIMGTKKPAEEGKNVFGFDMSKIRPLKGIKNEQKEETPKANT